MGCSQSKGKHPCEEEVKGLREKVRILEEKVNEIMCLRESESEAYEREMMVYEFKEADWKRERKRLREEAKRLRKELEEKEERIRGMLMEKDDEILAGEKSGITEKEYYWDWPLLVEQMMEERARRDEAVEKWKRLYLAIKIELDDLIQRTHQGGRLDWRAEEEDLLMEELQRELKAKEDTIALLQTRLASMEKEESQRGREVDILRQSLRIMSHNQKPTTNHHQNCQKPLKKVAFVKQQKWII